jgi:hypothetical protein
MRNQNILDTHMVPSGAVDIRLKVSRWKKAFGAGNPLR